MKFPILLAALAAFGDYPTSRLGGAGISVSSGPSYTASIAAATAHSVMTTGAGTGGFSTVTPGGSGTPLVSNGSSAEPTYQTLPASGGGTGLTSTGTAGNVLTSDGSLWTSAPVYAAARGTGGGAFTSTGGGVPIPIILDVCSATITVPSSGVLNVDARILISNTGAAERNVQWGLGIDSSTTFASQQMTVGIPGATTVNSDHEFAWLWTLTGLSAGSHTVHILAVQTSASSGYTGTGVIKLDTAP